MLYFFKLGYKIFKAKFFEKKFPFFVGWVLTNRCNNQCSYCNRWALNMQELDTKRVLEIISELSEIGTYRINFTGGEPLLRDDIDEIIKRTSEKRIKVIVSSNGILVPKKINYLKGIDMLELSLDGPEEINDYLRGKGSFKCVLAAAEAAFNKNIKVLFSTVITNLNINNLDYILKIAYTFNARTFFSLVDSNKFSSNYSKELLPDRKQFRLAIERLIEEKKRGNRNIGNSVSSLSYIKNWPIYNNKFRCYAGTIFFRIESNGDILFCSNFVNKERLANCKNSSFKEILSYLPKEYKCKTCWCGDKMEMNFILSFKIDSIFNAINLVFNNK